MNRALRLCSAFVWWVYNGLRMFSLEVSRKKRKHCAPLRAFFLQHSCWWGNQTAEETELEEEDGDDEEDAPDSSRWLFPAVSWAGPAILSVISCCSPSRLKKRSTSRWPFPAAKWAGVLPSLLVTSMLQPISLKKRNTSSWPFRAAQWAGVLPSLSVTSML